MVGDKVGDEVVGDVLIGADGIWSAVRAQRLRGVDPPPHAQLQAISRALSGAAADPLATDDGQEEPDEPEAPELWKGAAAHHRLLFPSPVAPAS